MTESNPDNKIPDHQKNENLRFYIVCPKDGTQFVKESEIQSWGKEVEEVLGEPLSTANCPICFSTLKVKEVPDKS